MGLDDVFKNASTAAFKVFKDLVVASFYVEVVDDGINPRTETTYPVGIIFSKMSEDEIDTLSFKKMIQPTDSIGLIEGPALSVDIRAGGNVIRSNGDEYQIIAYDVDPAKALWIILLRKP